MPSRGEHYVQATEDDSGSDLNDEELLIHAVGGTKSTPIKVSLRINGKQHEMELDTGAAITIMSEDKYKELFPGATLENSPVKLKTYTGEKLKVQGNLPVKAQYQDQVEDYNCRREGTISDGKRLAPTLPT